LNANLGIYAQDQWTFKRWTFNDAMRWEYVNEQAHGRKAVPLPSMGQPMTLRIPKNGRLVEWSPKPGTGRCSQPAARV
jgi:outer membrane receptor protein involved in Fe transport